MNTSTGKLALSRKVAAPGASPAHSNRAPLELLARYEIVMISHVLVTDQAGFSC